MAVDRVEQRDNQSLAVEEILGSQGKAELVNDVGELRALLRKLSKVVVEALVAVRREIDEGVEHRFCWDWEMVRELIEFEYRGAYFAAALMIALRSCMRQGARILILEGARREAVVYLRGLVTRERKLALQRGRQKPQTETQPKMPHTGVFKHDSWRDPGTKIAALRRRHSPVDVLEWFLETRAVATEEHLSEDEISRAAPALISSDASATAHRGGEFATYLESLTRLREEGAGMRNECDAANLATMSAIAAKTGSIEWRLVTGTQVLRRLKPGSTVSPIMFAVITALRDQFSTAQALEHYLNSCNARISELWDELSLDERELDSNARDIRRQDIAHVGELLAYVGRDPVLERLLRILANASVSAMNEFALVEKEIAEKARGLAVEDQSNVATFDMLVSRVERIYDHLQRRERFTAETLGIEWDSQPAQVGLAQQWKLRDRRHHHRVALTLDVYDDCYSVYWDTMASVGQFVQATNGMLSSAAERAALCRVVFLNSCSLDVPLEGDVDLTAILADTDPHDRIARIMIATGLGDFYYGVPNTDRAGFDRVFLRGDTQDELGFERNAQVAVVSNAGGLGFVDRLYRKTYLEFLPEGFVSAEIGKKLYEVGWRKEAAGGNAGGKRDAGR